ncbi:MAG TPA: hypothetical protein VME67_18895 [Mycobacterium sp.]|nr:hypothetical protein [Mycobacterium sp.]HTX96737.1 hypothetical protein [Mycobacterium sp.]
MCGKGVEAAALNGRARQSIRTAAYFDRSPDAVLGALNRPARRRHRAIRHGGMPECELPTTGACSWTSLRPVIRSRSCFGPTAGYSKSMWAPPRPVWSHMSRTDR